MYIRSAGPLHVPPGIVGNVQAMVHNPKGLKAVAEQAGSGPGVQMKSTGTQVKTVGAATGMKGKLKVWYWSVCG